MIEVDFMNKI